MAIAAQKDLAVKTMKSSCKLQTLLHHERFRSGALVTMLKS